MRLPRFIDRLDVRCRRGEFDRYPNHRERQAEIKRLLGGSFHDDGWILTHPDGTPIHPERFSREFLRKQEAYNKAHPDGPLPPLKLHGLRHTWRPWLSRKAGGLLKSGGLPCRAHLPRHKAVYK